MNRAWLVPLTGGLIATGIALGSRFLIGSVYSGANAMELIEALARSGLYLGTGIATSSATILALMLTLLGLTRRMDQEFDAEVYKRINWVGLLSTLSLCAALILLLLLTLPVGEFSELPEHWYPMMYNILVVYVGVLTGLLITTVLLLFTTLRHVGAKIRPSRET